MKVVSGKIERLAPTADGGYNGSHGYVWTFDMTVRSAEGTVSGEIGSKTQNYPLNIGAEITVEAKQTEHGPRLKKINPQYSGGGQVGGGKSPEQEDRIINGNALNAVMSAANIMPDEIGPYLIAGKNWIKTGVWSLAPQAKQDIPGPDVGEEYVSNDPADKHDEIPF